MKALDLLKNIDRKCCTDRVNGLLDLAIKEIKELENRSCSNCKYNKAQDSFMIFCDCIMCKDGSKMMWHSFTKDFCCNKWENKA